MATPAEHYDEAEKIMADHAEWRKRRQESNHGRPVEVTAISLGIEANFLATAQYHATMACSNGGEHHE